MSEILAQVSETGACREGGCGVAWPLGSRVREKAEASDHPDLPFAQGRLRRRVARTAYASILDATNTSLIHEVCFRDQNASRKRDVN